MRRYVHSTTLFSMYSVWREFSKTRMALPCRIENDNERCMRIQKEGQSLLENNNKLEEELYAAQKEPNVEIEKLTAELKTIQEEIADNSKEYAELTTQRDKLKDQLDQLDRLRP